MDKLTEFKKFIATMPSIKEDVLNGRYTWQQLYELYDVYGKEDKFWEPYQTKVNNTMDLSAIVELVKGIDLNALSSGLATLEKVLNVASGFLVKNEPTNQKQPQKNKWYDE